MKMKVGKRKRKIIAKKKNRQNRHIFATREHDQMKNLIFSNYKLGYVFNIKNNWEKKCHVVSLRFIIL